MQRCNECLTIRCWTRTGKTIDGVSQWQCRNCGNKQLEERPVGLKIPPKILYLDIETALMSVDLYDLKVYSKYISYKFITQHSYVINWAAAWLDTEYNIIGRIKSGVCTADEAKRRDDKRILRPLWEMMDISDYISGHNSDNFDIKKLNWRFMANKMGLPYKSKRLDTYKMIGKHTKPPSKGLEFQSVTLGGSRKKSLSLEEWQAIVNVNTDESVRTKLLKKANVYCRGDVNEGVLVLREYASAIEHSGDELVYKNVKKSNRLTKEQKKQRDVIKCE